MSLRSAKESANLVSKKMLIGAFHRYQMKCKSVSKKSPRYKLTCAISGESLAYRFTGDTPEQWLASFRQHRWDLEEEAENLIQEQSEDDQGWVWLP